MRNSIILLFIASLFTCLQLSAQGLSKVHGGYELDSVFYNNELDIIQLLDEVPAAKEAYLKSQSYHSKANKFGGISLASMGLSALLIRDGLSGMFIDFKSFLLGYGFAILACTTGTIGLIYADKRGSHKKKVLKLYNEGNLESSYNHNPYDLKIGASASGIGLFVSF